MPRQQLVLLLIVLLFVACPAVLHAQSQNLTVDPADMPLIIRGNLAGQTASFGGDLRLTATTAAVTDLQLLAADLQLEDDSSVRIDRSNITTPAGTTLSVGQPRDIRVMVANVVRPGTYKPVPPQQGVRLIATTQAGVETLVVPIEAHIDATPVVVLSGAGPNLQIARCLFPWLDCALAPLFVARDANAGGAFTLDNHTQTQVEPVLPAVVVMHGEKTGETIGPDALDVNVPTSLPPNSVTNVSVVAKPGKLRSDHYTGTILLNFKGTQDRLVINSDVSVRDGPVFPLLMVLLGIAFGRIVRQMQSPEAVTQVKLLPRYYELSQAAGNVTNTDAQTWIQAELERIKQRIAKAADTEDVLTQALDTLDSRVELLASLDAIEAQLAAGKFASLRSQLAPLLGQARQAVFAKNDANAQQIRKQVQDIITAAEQDLPMGSADAQVLTRVADWLQRAGVKLAHTVDLPRQPQLGEKRKVVARVLGLLSGTDLQSAEIRFWLFRPLLFVLLLVLLTLLGMQALYVNAGATFGTGGIYDYLGLVLWGLSADIAQRTLQNLPAAS